MEFLHRCGFTEDVVRYEILLFSILMVAVTYFYKRLQFKSKTQLHGSVEKVSLQAEETSTFAEGLLRDGPLSSQEKAHLMLKIRPMKSRIESAISAHRQKFLGECTTAQVDQFDYVLQLKAKRVRPVLTLLAYDLFEPDIPDWVVETAIGVELSHNSSLIHDDIMDEAPLRRGSETLHTKYDINSAILAGDLMLITGFQCLLGLDADLLKRCLRLTTKTAVEVCVGQRMDMEFPERDDITASEYLEMIRLKTSVLIGCALKMGAYAADVSEVESCKLYDFGINLGLAFQIQDDYLDLWGDSKTFGKRIGGDVYQNKKTILYIRALEVGTNDQKAELRDLYSNSDQDDSKLHRVKRIFESLDVHIYVEKLAAQYKDKALQNLGQLKTKRSKKKLVALANYFVQRST